MRTRNSSISKLTNYARTHLNCLWLFFLCSFAACSLQEYGETILRKRFDSGQKDCHVELLIDKSSNEILLAYVLLNTNQSFSEVDLKAKDGKVVSVTNTYLHAPNSSSFGFGSGWNRSTDEVVIDSTEFSRKNGCVFFVVNDGSEKQIFQLTGSQKFDGIEAFFAMLRKSNDEQSVINQIDAASSRIKQ